MADREDHDVFRVARTLRRGAQRSHRLIYKATEDAVLIAQCHYRYES
ncbi:hypothetical protein [Streptomyces mirabilis]